MKKIMLMMIVLAAVGCGRSENIGLSYSADKSEAAEYEYDSEDLAVMENANALQSRKDAPPQIDVLNPIRNLKLIKTGNVAFESADLDATAKRIAESIHKNGGYASNENESKSSYLVSRTITIRVPSNRFDALLADISVGVDRFDERDISVADVTEEFYDITARLKTKKEIEARYIQILSRAGKITEVLEVEKQIGEIREEIERIEGRLKFLNNQVSMSTLTISYYETLTPVAENEYGFFSKLMRSFVKGWDLVLSLLLGIASVWPLIVLVIGALLGLRRWRKSRRS